MTSYPSIIGQPSDDDVKHLCEMLTNLLQSIDLPGGTDSLSGLIDDPIDYPRLQPSSPPHASIQPLIAPDATDAVRVKAEQEWTATATRQRLIPATECLGRIFITTVVEDTWLLPLKSPTTFYNKVSLQLAASTAGLEATDIVSLLVDMQLWWEEDHRVPEYINKLEDAPKKALRAFLPITNEWLVTTASKSLLSAASFPIQRPVWDYKPLSTKTWAAWKQWARESQLTIEREQRASGARGDTFGSASAAIGYHCPVPSSSHANRAFHAPALSFEAQFTSGMDALAFAATNKKTVLDNLVASNTTLSKLTAKKLTHIEQLLSSRSGAPHQTSSLGDSKLVVQLLAAIKGKWVPGGFCSTHGYSVSADHDSASCIPSRPQPQQAPVTPKSCPLSGTTCWELAKSATVTAGWYSTKPPSLSLPPMAPLSYKVGVNRPAPNSGDSRSSHWTPSPLHQQRTLQQPLMHMTYPASAHWSITYRRPPASLSSPPGLPPSKLVTLPVGLGSPTPTHPKFILPVMKPSKGTYPKYDKACAPPNPRCSPPILTTTPASPSKELHIWSDPISKLFTDDMGRFPVCSRSGNQYIMLAYHCNSNAILVEPFQSCNDRHCIPAYSRLMSRLQAHGHTVNHQVLDNEASAEFIRTITQDWKATYQLVPPDIHRRNLAKRAIQTFKAHFLSVLAGVSNSFPNYLWDKLLPQTQLTLNLLRQSSVTPSLSAWEYFNNTPFNFDATHLGPCGCPVLIHNKPSKCSSWAFRGRDGFNIGPSLSHYRCFQVIDAETKAIVISDTVEFRHTYLSPPSHPKYQEIWSSSYAKELGRLCQGFQSSNPNTPPVDGTDTFHVIDFTNIPPDRLQEVCYSNVVCKVRPEKTDPDRTRITIAGNRICYPGDVGTKTAPLELVKLMINSVLSRQDPSTSKSNSLTSHKNSSPSTTSCIMSTTAGAHMMLSKDIPAPPFNGPVLTLSQVIKFVASSAAEAELAGLYICAKEMVPLRNSLGWPQPNSPIQPDKTTALGVANKTIITHKMKSMDMRLW
eukprot:CCRYP_016175-RA/>CCRYP_016175-RA protein AED:0.26 eAED:0.26 QI:0/0/0/0.6/0.75/0.8/5/0/1027